jgi:ketosteroid isomerase-like protein
MGDRLPVATGREVVLNGVTIIELRDGRIIRAADYIDTAPLLLQLGGRIELPGGVVIELEGVR